MKIITVATHSDGYFEVLRESCARFGHELVVLGFGEKWQGFIWKFRQVQDYFLFLPDENEYVIFVDAFDVICIADEKRILSRFAKFAQHEFVMSVELETGLFRDLIFRWMYGSPCYGIKLNTGLYGGTVKKMREFFNHVFSFVGTGNMKEIDDQALAMKALRKDPELFLSKFAADTQAYLFLNIIPNEGKSTGQDLFRVDKTEKKVIVNRSGMEPCFIHSPGNIRQDEYIALYGFTSRGVPRMKGHGGTHKMSRLNDNEFAFIHYYLLLVVFVPILVFLALSIVKKKKNKGK